MKIIYSNDLEKIQANVVDSGLHEVQKKGVVIYYIQINVCDKNAKNLKILNCLGDIAHSTE